MLLSLVADSRWLIGLDLAHNQFRGAIVNLRGVFREEVTIPFEGTDGDKALQLVYSIVDQLMQKGNPPIVGHRRGHAGTGKHG